MDFHLLSRGRFDIFKPVDVECAEISNQDNLNTKHMVIKMQYINYCTIDFLQNILSKFLLFDIILSISIFKLLLDT